MATQILPPHTRVILTYRGDEHQGVILKSSTQELAHVEVLGRVDHPEVRVVWSQVTKTEYRCFEYAETEDTFVITEVAPKNLHPMNWAGLGQNSREGVWGMAKARGKMTVFVSLDGSRRDLGRIFDPRAFEKAVYQGYVGYTHSMSDGACCVPISFDSWAQDFRADPAAELSSYNSTSESVKAALPLYLKALKSVGLR